MFNSYARSSSYSSAKFLADKLKQLKCIAHTQTHIHTHITRDICVLTCIYICSKYFVCLYLPTPETWQHLNTSYHTLPITCTPQSNPFTITTARSQTLLIPKYTHQRILTSFHASSINRLRSFVYLLVVILFLFLLLLYFP